MLWEDHSKMRQVAQNRYACTREGIFWVPVVKVPEKCYDELLCDIWQHQLVHQPFSEALGFPMHMGSWERASLLKYVWHVREVSLGVHKWRRGAVVSPPCLHPFLCHVTSKAQIQHVMDNLGMNRRLWASMDIQHHNLGFYIAGHFGHNVCEIPKLQVIKHLFVQSPWHDEVWLTFALVSTWMIERLVRNWVPGLRPH